MLLYCFRDLTLLFDFLLINNSLIAFGYHLFCFVLEIAVCFCWLAVHTFLEQFRTCCLQIQLLQFILYLWTHLSHIHLNISSFLSYYRLTISYLFFDICFVCVLLLGSCRRSVEIFIFRSSSSFIHFVICYGVYFWFCGWKKFIKILTRYAFHVLCFLYSRQKCDFDVFLVHSMLLT